MKTPHTIVLIDDDDGPTRYYEAALTEAGFEVVRLRSFVEAMNFIHKPDRPTPAMWILDIMMPIEYESLIVDGVDIAKATNRGLGAGPLLYQEMRKTDKTTPAMILTCITNPTMLDIVESELHAGDRCEAKLDFPPSKLIERVCEIVAEVTEDSKQLKTDEASQ